MDRHGPLMAHPRRRKVAAVLRVHKTGAPPPPHLRGRRFGESPGNERLVSRGQVGCIIEPLCTWQVSSSVYMEEGAAVDTATNQSAAIRYPCFGPCRAGGSAPDCWREDAWPFSKVIPSRASAEGHDNTLYELTSRSDWTATKHDELLGRRRAI